jgi:hypothetical protein
VLGAGARCVYFSHVEIPDERWSVFLRARPLFTKTDGLMDQPMLGGISKPIVVLKITFHDCK